MTTFDAHQYALDCGWDFSCIEATAAKGLSETDEENLAKLFGGESREAEESLLAWCKEQVAAAKRA